jgi:hypothetical protein
MDAAIEVTATAKVLHAIIESNFFDSNGLGAHIVATGTAAAPHRGLTIRANKHAEAQSDIYALTYVNNSSIRGIDMAGNAGSGGSLGNGIVLNNVDTLSIESVFGLQLGQSGIVARNCSRIRVSHVVLRAIGTDGSTTGHGFDFDSTNTQCNFQGLVVEGTDGYGFTGSPAFSKFGSYEFRSCLLGNIDSTTFTPDKVFLSASSMGSVTGSPTLAGVPGVGYPMAWQLDASNVEQVVGQVDALPNEWETFDIYIVWAPTDGSAGNVVFDVNYSFIVAGQLTSNGNTPNPGTAQPSPGQAGKAAFYRIASGKSRGTAPMVIRVDRNATSANDTYPADVSLIGIQIVRAS